MRSILLPIFLILASLGGQYSLKAQQVKVFDSLMVVEYLSVYFDSDSSVIKLEYIDSVSGIIQSYGEQKLQRLTIEAHTDSIGSVPYNEKLSHRRANSTQSLLQELGIEMDSIKIIGHGELKPIAPNMSEEGRSKNRRVDIHFYTVKKFGILSGLVVNDSTKTGIPARVVLRSKDHRDTITTDSSGKFMIETPVGEVVFIESNAKDHFFVSKPLKVTPSTLKKDLVLEMPRIATGKKFELENLYFVGNQAVLLPKSVPVLHRLLEFMKINPEVCIRIDGHINLPNQGPAPKESWHWRLSDNRTKTVYNFLVENDVYEPRMRRKAFANWQMVYPKAKQEKFMKKNRRVEILILDCKEL